jgi:aminopeptidase N
VRLYFPLLLSIFLGGCSNLDYFLTTGTVKLTERNRLLGELLPERACYDILFYDINIEIDVDKKYIKGYVDFTALAVENFEKLQVDLAKSMQLNNVEYNGKILSTNRKEDAVYINFPKITAGSEFTFRVYYEGSPQVAKNPPWDGGFVWEKDEAGRDYVSVACEGDGCGLWWPLKDHISDEPDKGARMSFTVPKELMCVSNGRLIDASDNDNGTRTYIWQVVNPINNYNISVQLGNYVSLVDTVHRSNGKIETMNHYVLDYHKEVASTVFPQARKVIRFFEKNFGDYQFWEDGFKLVEVSYLGMEHQSAVTYGNVWSNWGGDHRSWTRDYYGIIDGLLFHETAHEWWGNSVTAKDPAHVWIHEGMAVYSEAMFIEQELGYNVMIDFMRKKRRFQNISPIVGPENENYWAFGDSYNKGAWAMHTLRHVVNNDNLWWDTIKTFATENAKSNVNTKDFISHVENKTKMPLSYFFDQYFFDKRVPTLQYFQVGNQFHYRWADTVSDFAMPINIEINGQEKRIIPKIEKQTLTISEHSVVHVKDWQFLLNKKRVQM